MPHTHTVRRYRINGLTGHLAPCLAFSVAVQAASVQQKLFFFFLGFCFFAVKNLAPASTDPNRNGTKTLCVTFAVAVIAQRLQYQQMLEDMKERDQLFML